MSSQPITTEVAQSIQHALQAFEMQFHSLQMPYETKVNLVKRQFIIAELERCGWNQCKAAKKLGLHRNTLRENMIVLRIHRPSR